MDIFPGGAEAGLFEAFTAPDTNRLLFLERLLKAKDIPCTVVELAGRAHIAVRFGKGAYHPFFQTTTLIAHYDRDEGPPPSPGANDNSAACFLLVELAEKLLTRENHNIMILFIVEFIHRRGRSRETGHCAARRLCAGNRAAQAESDSRPRFCA